MEILLPYSRDLSLFTNLVNQELELDYCSSTVVLAVAFNSWPTETDISGIKE